MPLTLRRQMWSSSSGLVELLFDGELATMSTKLSDGKTMRDGHIFSARLNNVVTTEREFDELVAKSLPELSGRATVPQP